MFSRFLLVLVVMLMTGCTALPTVEPVATPQSLRVELSSGVDWMRPAMAECSQEVSGLSLSVQTIALPDQSLEKADVLLRWWSQSPKDGLAVELGEDTLKVIVHPDNPIGELDASVIKELYTGKIANWPAANGGPALAVHPWVLPSENETQVLFESTMLGGEQIVKTAMIAPSPTAMLEVVAADPQAIGFVSVHWHDSTVKSIEIRNITAKEWTMPILAITESEPAGVVRDWLLCVQERIKPNE